MSDKSKNNSGGLSLNDFDWEQIIFEAFVKAEENKGNIVTEADKAIIKKMVHDEFSKKKLP